MTTDAASAVRHTGVGTDSRREGFTLAGAVPSRAGLVFRRPLSFERWLEVGRRVRVHADASNWWLGDWLNYGSGMYGRRYKRGIELTGLDYQTLRNYAGVARRFELSRRREGLSFQHHAEVCALDDDTQDRWLDRAEQEGWPRNELRRRLREEQQEAREVIPAAMRLTVDPDRRGRWQEAADLSGSTLEAWIVTTLDRAATTSLASAPRRSSAAGDDRLIPSVTSAGTVRRAPPGDGGRAAAQLAV